MISIPTKVSTYNENLDTEIKVEYEVEVPEDIEEAAEFYGGEEKVLEVLQKDTKRRKDNAVRPVLRELESDEVDFETIAKQTASSYAPGRRGGFGRTVDADGLAEAAASGSLEQLAAFLQAEGISVEG